MSKERKHIDDLFKEELQDYSLETSMADFDAIMDKMNPKKKRRIPFWWFYLCAGIAIIGSAITIHEFYSLENIDSVEVVEFSPKEAHLSNMKDANTSIESEVLNDESLNGNLDASPTTDETGVSPLSQSEEKELVLSINRIAKVESKQDAQKAKNKNQISSEKEAITSKEAPTAKVFNEKDNKGTVKDSNEVPEEKVMAVDAIKDTVSENMVSKDLAEPIDTVNTTKEPSQKLLNNTPFQSKWRLAIMGSYMQSARAIESSNTYADVRENGEKNTASLSFGIQLHREFKNGFSLGTGLEKNSFNNEANYVYSRKKFDLLPVLNPSGDTIGYFKNNFRDTTEEFKATNRINVLRLPIQAQYSFTIQKSGFRIGGGLYGDYITKVTGELPENEDLIPTNAKQIFTKDFMIGWSAEIGYFRPLTNKIYLDVKTNYSASFTNLLGNDDAGDKPILFGMGVGLSYKF